MGRRVVLAVALHLAACFCLARQVDIPDEDALTAPYGKVVFRTSCLPEAQQLFEEGLAQLHLFFFDVAAATFDRALQADPQCTMAHWGSAMIWYRPLWWVPTIDQLSFSQWHLQLARETFVLSRVTEREKAFVRAAETLFSDHKTNAYKERALMYERSMKRLLLSVPSDEDAAEETVAYALSALGKTAVLETGDMEFDKGVRAMRDEVGMMLERVLDVHPHHCGALHFLLHAYDSTSRAARAYDYAAHLTTLAPKVPHARHMPIHIYVRLGKWVEASLGEAQSLTAVVDYMQATEPYCRVFPPQDSPEAALFHPFRDSSIADMNDTIGDYFHSLSYLLYALEQLGRYRLADHLIQENLMPMKCITEAYDQGTIYTFVSSPARLLIEQGRWTELALYDEPPSMRKKTQDGWAYVMKHYLRLTGLARLQPLSNVLAGDDRLGRDTLGSFFAVTHEFQRGRELGGWFVSDTFGPDWRATVDVQILLTHANLQWLLALKALQVNPSLDRDALFKKAIQLVSQAAALEDKIEKPTVKPSVVYPARQQLAERLAELGQFARAYAAYSALLLEHPRRFGGVLGMARAAKALGKSHEAAEAYRVVLKLCQAVVEFGTLDPELCDDRVLNVVVRELATRPECDATPALREARDFLENFEGRLNSPRAGEPHQALDSLIWPALAVTVVLVIFLLFGRPYPLWRQPS